MQHEKKLADIDGKKLDAAEFHQNSHKCDHWFDEMQQKLDETRIQCTTLDRFVDRYLPVRIQSQMGQTLHSILGVNSKHRLQLYEITAFQKLNNAVLGDQKAFANTKHDIINLEDNIKATLEELIVTLKECQEREEARALTRARKNVMMQKGPEDPNAPDRVLKTG